MSHWFGSKSRSDPRRWLDKKREEALTKIGTRKGQTVLDSGCSSGNYTIPIAGILGEEGKAYALDNKGRALDEFIQRARSEGLET